MRMITSPRSNQSGFILVTVLMMISMIAAVAYYTNRSAMFANQQSGEPADQIDPQKAAYAIEAGLAIATKELQEDDDCTAYSINSTGTFNNLTYLVNLSQTSNSPVTVTVSIDDNGSLIGQASRKVKMYDSSGGTTEVTLNAEDDSFIGGFNSNNNYSTGSDGEKLVVMASVLLSLLKFPVSDLDVPSQYVTNGQLELHLLASPIGSIQDVKLSRVKRDWDEAVVSFRDRLVGKVWDEYYFLVGDNAGPVLTSTAVNESIVGWKYWDATQMVTEWLDGTHTNFGLMLKGGTFQYNPFDFHSSNSSESDKHPLLRMTHYCECGATDCEEPVSASIVAETEDGKCKNTEVTTFSPTDDSYIKGAETTTNYSTGSDGESLNVQSSYGHLSFLKFDLSKFTVPAKDIVSSQLVVHLKGTAELNLGDVYLKRVKLDWDEKFVTYAKRTKNKYWLNYHYPAGDNFGPTLSTTRVNESLMDWKYWDTTELVNDWVDKTYLNYGLVLYGASSQGNNLEFHSSNSSDTSKHPYLEVTHKCQ